MAYHPVFFSTGEAANNTPIVMVLFVLLGVLSIITIRRIGLKRRLIKSMFLCTVAITIISYILLFSGLNIDSSEAIAYIQVMIGVILGYNLSLSLNQWHIVLRTYMLTSLIMGFMLVTNMVGSFQIVEQYLVSGKNASGVMIAISGAIAFYLARVDKSRLLRAFDYLVLALLLLELLVFRARLATLSLFLLVLLFLYKERSIKLLIGVGIAVLVVAVISPAAKSFITDSFFMNKETDITSGRGELNSGAITIISNSPLIGNLNHDFTILDETNVHNYVLKRLSDFGLIISLPWIIIYLVIGITVIKRFYWINHSNRFHLISYLLMILLLLESFGEYSYPFSPGTITLIPFIMLGVAERERVFNSHKHVRSVQQWI